MPISTEQILHPARYAAGDRPDRLAFEAAGPGPVRCEDGLGEFEIRLLLEQYLGDESAAALLATGWDGDRYQVLGADAEALVWYSLWDDPAAGARFFKAIERAWAKRRSGAGAAAGRRSQGQPPVGGGVAGGRPGGAPAGGVGWRPGAAHRVTPGGGRFPPPWIRPSP